MDKKDEYVPYPSLDKAEDYLKYRILLNSKKGKNNSVAKKKNSKAQKDNTIKKSSTKKTDHKSKLLKLAQEAKHEELVEKSSSGNAPTRARKKLIDEFILMYHMGIKLSQKQLQYTMNFLYWHPETVESKYIKFLIPATAEIIGYKEAIKMTNELANILEDTKYGKPLKDYSKWLSKKSTIDKIQKMKSTGMNNTQISEELHISSAEVAVLLDNNETFVFRGEGER